ncbi:AcrR family transcriptional regulator [Leifsonia sp. AK011]|uniref:TetR/AcrR family transcriptional regulator n=1 Tax=Leifsonia sp. AK011 TaxID=2723075 RepID=UPI0015C7AAB6|nr:TetR/AcrR family transcriptional regulator [Leifsonia sp. AK011]NYF11152.1 AcrR family transcriptional regulator [Leifsonia sp. AK011]
MTTSGATKHVRKDAARNRARLLEAAREVFAERGLEATLDDVAGRAGVGIGTAYRHFANKQELAAEILIASSDRMVAEAQAALEAEDAWEALVGFFEGAIERMSQDRGLHDTLVQQRGPVTSSPFREALIEAIVELFERAQRAGVIRPDAVPTDVAPIFGMMGVAIDMASASSPDLWRRYLQLWFDGLRAHDVEPLSTPPLAIEEVSAALAAGKRHK